MSNQWSGSSSSSRFDGREQCRTASLSSQALSAKQAEGLAKLFKALSDPVRLRLLTLIAADENGETCVCNLTPEFDLTAPTISYHLKALRTAGLIDCQRRGTWVYYWVVPGVLEQLGQVFGTPAPKPLAGSSA